MANHVRQQLREAIATAVTSLTTTGTRVFQSRVYPIEISQLPCLVVTSDGDSVGIESAHRPHHQQRTTTIRIEAYARAVSDLDDTLDTICKEVEIAMGALSSGVAADCYLRGTKLDLESFGEQPIGKATLIYSKDLYTLSNAADVLI